MSPHDGHTIGLVARTPSLGASSSRQWSKTACCDTPERRRTPPGPPTHRGGPLSDRDIHRVKTEDWLEYSSSCWREAIRELVTPEFIELYRNNTGAETAQHLARLRLATNCLRLVPQSGGTSRMRKSPTKDTGSGSSPSVVFRPSFCRTRPSSPRAMPASPYFQSCRKHRSVDCPGMADMPALSELKAFEGLLRSAVSACDYCDERIWGALDTIPSNINWDTAKTLAQLSPGPYKSLQQAALIEVEGRRLSRSGLISARREEYRFG